MTDSAERAITGLIGAVAIAAFSRSRNALTTGGAAAAAAVGTICAAAGWTWAGLLIVFFTTGTLLSRMAPAAKAAHTAGIAEKSGNRDHTQQQVDDDQIEQDLGA